MSVSITGLIACTGTMIMSPFLHMGRSLNPHREEPALAVSVGRPASQADSVLS